MTELVTKHTEISHLFPTKSSSIDHLGISHDLIWVIEVVSKYSNPLEFFQNHDRNQWFTQTYLLKQINTNDDFLN